MIANDTSRTSGGPLISDILVLVAHRLELAGFAGQLTIGADPAAAPAISELHGMRVAAAEVGVGMPAAGGGCARALERCHARAAILLGSFGAYPGPGLLPLGTLLAPESVHAVDLASLQQRAALPSVMPQLATCDPALVAGLLHCVPDTARGALATTLGITTDDALAHELAERSGCQAENLEAIAVALACAARSVPFAALLACTNQVGSQGRSQWAAEHERAAYRTAHAFLTWLEHGAPGLPS